MSHICPVHSKDSQAITITKSAESDDTKIAMCASLELDSCRAENSQLKLKLIEYEATIKNLEQLVTTIADKQHQILSEVVEMRKESRAAPMESNPQMDTSEPSSVQQLDDDEEEDGYRPDSESEGTQSPDLDRQSSVASLISLCFSSTSSLGISIDGANSDSDYDRELYVELGMGRYSDHDPETDHSEENGEDNSVPLTPPVISPIQDFINSDTDSE
ncbi:uncharacterized protein LOC128252707 [Drosophila gunungcola]|uniref:uncharacterized protein LOC128252707 n=1 Tax=Drosophila gunungcola TaxID=103775 RepID=UPI0022E7EAEA|nr:uncharacterized protein LOC128252707 [Drosophila gunungcola]XP_052836614.1 uncharacterized protein LOC128252707 [Drosophila gunungcola]